MTDAPTVTLAQRIALAVPVLLLGGAYLSQYGFGLYPCEMCWWQRWPHFVAAGLAAMSFFAPPKRLWIALSALAMLVSGLIGAFHAGVEYHWWPGITSCAAVVSNGTGSALDSIMNAPMVRCDEAPWRLFGISLAGYNFLISTAAALFVLSLLARRRAA